MINLLVGQPGGGKSYEAVAFHILPALEQGRKVITNLPLNVEAFRALDARYPDLLVLRHSSVEQVVEKRRWNLYARAFDAFKVKEVHRPFASIADYGDEWRHPVKGFGALYVIDECHLCLPRRDTAVEVEEWFSLHRHELADVLLITQSYGKVCKPICDMVQVLYRVKKATAFGTNNSYIRKVQDGIGGDVVNTTVRDYDKKYFGLYTSHTKSSAAGQELAANDIVPLWKRWPVLGAGLCGVLLVGLLAFGGVSLNPIKQATAKTVSVGQVEQVAAVSAVPAAPVAALPEGLEPYHPPKPVSQVSGKPAAHPFDGLTLHIVGFLESASKWRYHFMAEQNGQPAFQMTQADLEQSGYAVEKLSACSARIRYGEYSFFAVCDSLRVSISAGLPGNS